MWIKARLIVIVFFSAVCTFVCSTDDPDFLNESLLKEVKPTRIGEHFEFDRPVSISWMDTPPYIYHEEEDPTPEQELQNISRKVREVSNESEENQEKGRPLKSEKNLKGIFYEIVNKGLQICYVRSSEGVNYTTKSKNLQLLDQTIVTKIADIALPVHGSEDGKYGGYEYVEILKSPGVVFIENKEQIREASRQKVARAMKDTWPVLVITLLFTGFAGLFVWGLVSTRKKIYI